MNSSNYSITEICAPYKSLEISLSLKPVKVPYFTSLEVRSTTETIFTRTYSDFSVTKDLMQILAIPDLKIKIFDIGGCVFNQEEFLDRVLEALKKNNVNIRSDTLHFHNTTKELTLKNIDLLRNFDPEVLYGIEINTKVSREVFQEMVETDQWKKAKKLTMFSSQNARSIDNFLHFEKIFLIDYPKISPEDCWKIIKSFRHRDLPIKSFFDISGTTVEISEVISLYDEPEKCEEKDSEYVQHIQHFNLKNDLILEIRLYKDKILGRIGTKESLQYY
ncbi:hypothetical protein CAEBREN_14596 [Caenorhabditis brenneri]|uniref:DUF38 domain-containing protein n=1 Tax=Caenorhabditis brenneri TaxID=135651 RepID=G0N0L3_CAEBE|nr:hypothetical protein CAEBREN_14596 [Caenorhabditis brenneri]